MKAFKSTLHPVNEQALETLVKWASDVFLALQTAQPEEDPLTVESFDDVFLLERKARMAHELLPEAERQRLGLYKLERPRGEWILRSCPVY